MRRIPCACSLWPSSILSTAAASSAPWVFADGGAKKRVGAHEATQRGAATNESTHAEYASQQRNGDAMAAPTCDPSSMATRRPPCVGNDVKTRKKKKSGRTNLWDIFKFKTRTFSAGLSSRIVPVDAAACRPYRDPGARNHS